MSKVNELIKKLCPNGAEYKSLGSIVSISTGKLNANAMVEDGEYAFFTCDANPFRIDKYAFDGEAILISGNGSQVGHLNYYIGKFNAYQRTYVLMNFVDDIVPKFLYHYLNTYLKGHIDEKSKKGSVPYITLPMLQGFNVPIPPLEVQKEIVKILDKFSKLEAELEAELEARKSQYEFWREIMCGGNIEELEKKKNIKLMKLSDLGEIIRGKRFVKADAVDEGIPCMHYGELYTYYGISAFETKSKVRNDLAPKLRYADKNDVIIVGAGENNIDIGIGVAWLGDKKVAIHDACYILKHNINPKYISYYLRTKLYHNQLKSWVSEGKICAVSAKGVGESIIPIPSIEEQNHIVNILDKFDALVNDITVGIPAEIELRRQQYEYYRNKLLSFEELSCE